MMGKKHQEEHENHERWLVSYADFITLLFAFFVVLYSVSKVDNKKLVETAHAIKWAMHFAGTGGVGEMPIFDTAVAEGSCPSNVKGGDKNMAEVKRVLETTRRRIENKLQAVLLGGKPPVKVITEVEGRRLIIRLAAAHFFDPAEAALRPESLPVLDAIASELAKLDRPVRVDGYTDSEPLQSSRYRDNWELSTSRAARVVSYLEKAHDIDRLLLSAAGYADTRPIADEKTADGRELNRRVELVVEVQPGGRLAQE